MKAFLNSIGPALLAYGPWGIFVLSFIDSVGLPLPAAIDIMLIGIGAGSHQHPERAYFAALMATVGSVLGNLVLFLGAQRGARWLSRSSKPPEGKRRKFGAWFQRYGLLTVFVPAALPIVPLPLKVFVVSAAAMRTPLSRFMAAIVVGRVLRYFGQVYLGLELGEEGTKYFFARHGWAVAGAGLAFTAALYLVIRMLDRRGQAEA